MTETKEKYDFHISAYDLDNGDFNIHKNVEIVGKKAKTLIFLKTIQAFLNLELEKLEKGKKDVFSKNNKLN